MSGIVDDFEEGINKSIDDAKTTTIWPGTIVTVNPLTVQLDGSGVAVDCLAVDFVSLIPQRRCIVQQVGTDLIVMGTYGGAELDTLNIDNNLAVPNMEPINASVVGSDNNLSLSAAFEYLATPAYVVFTTPPSGRIAISFNTRLLNATNSGTGATIQMSYEIRSGSTIGSGGLVLSPAGSRAISLRTPNADYGFISAGRFDFFELNPNTVYHAQAMAVVSAADATNTYIADSVRLAAHPQF